MQLDLSAPALVNAGGAALFLLVGLGVLPFARGSRRAWLLGLAAASFGLLYVVQNVVSLSDGALDGALLLGGAATLSLATLVAITVDLAMPLSARAKVALLAFATLGVALWAGAGLALYHPDLAETRGLTGFAATSKSGMLAEAILALEQTALFVFVATIGLCLHASPSSDRSARSGLAALALAFAPFVVLLGAITAPAAAAAPFRGAAIERFQAWNLVYCAAFLLAILPIAATRERRGAIEQAAVVVPIVTGLAGVVIALAGADVNAAFGSYGIVRAVGAAFLAYGILRHDLLGLRFPRLAVKRGAAATSALAILFVVAQLAQNFFTARFGLVLGGIVAGTFLFAAQPLQRAMERVTSASSSSSSSHSSSSPSPSPHASRPSPSLEQAFRAAVRAALNDGRMNDAEEHHLAEVAEHLGIGPRDALRIRRDVERELLREDPR